MVQEQCDFVDHVLVIFDRYYTLVFHAGGLGSIPSHSNPNHNSKLKIHDSFYLLHNDLVSYQLKTLIKGLCLYSNDEKTYFSSMIYMITLLPMPKQLSALVHHGSILSSNIL